MKKSNGIVDEKGVHGQTVKRAFPLDRSDMDLPDTRGGSFGGSTTNLAHSLSDDTAQQRGNPGGKKSPYIPNH